MCFTAILKGMCTRSLFSSQYSTLMIIITRSPGNRSFHQIRYYILPKATNIPPLLENGLFVTNFQNKAEIFNNYFVQQCSLNMNDSVLPRSYITRCNNPLETNEIDAEKVLKRIQSFDCNKAHGWDDMSVSMVKICHSSIVRLLCLLYKTCMHTGSFSDNWKKANVLPIHKKESRQLKKNYRLISLFPVCGKIFEKVIFDTMYRRFTDNQLLTPNQSGFRPGDSTINQLLYII